MKGVNFPGKNLFRIIAIDLLLEINDYMSVLAPLLSSVHGLLTSLPYTNHFFTARDLTSARLL